VLSGSNESGAAIAGTCGEEGSTASLVDLVIVCSLGLDGGDPVDVTFKVSKAIIQPGDDLVGIFTA
jgi:hypothetical protein